MNLNLTLTKPLAVFDIESAGDPYPDPQTDRIISLAIMVLKPGVGTWTDYDWIVNPGIPISPERTAIHGFDDASVADRAQFKRHAQEVMDVIQGCDLAGYNSKRYDVPLLWEEFHRAGLEWDPMVVNQIDACVIFRKQEPRDLTAAMRFYCGREHTGAHGAIADCHATLEVLKAQLARYSDVPTGSPEALAKFCCEDARLDIHGIILANEYGVPVFGTKRNRDVPVVNDIGYAQWMLRSDFSEHTKIVIRRILAELNKFQKQEEMF